MNKYKVEIKELLKKEIMVEAETPKEALDLIEKVFLKSNIITFEGKDIETIETEVIEENEENIKDKYEVGEDEFYEDKENFEMNLEEIDARLNDIDEFLLEIKKSEDYIDNKMNFQLHKLIILCYNFIINLFLNKISPKNI